MSDATGSVPAGYLAAKPDDISDDDNVAQMRLGEILQRNVGLEPERLERALKLRAESDQRLGDVLVQLGYVSGKHLASALAQQFRLALADSADFPDQPLLEGRVSSDFLAQSRAVALAETDEHVVVALANPDRTDVLTAIELAVGKSAVARVATASDIDAANRRYSSKDERSGGTANSSEDDVRQLRESARGEPAINYVNDLLGRAVRLRASDVHLEPYPGALRVRVRVDGVLRDLESPAPGLGPAVVSRIKVLAGLNIAERRLPQDGRMRYPVEGRQMDMRVSTLPSMNGESVVMRLLDSDTAPLDLAGLGMRESIVNGVIELVNRPHGMVLVTGPTGSGKTTTLYAALQTLNTDGRKLLTVEDPVEYQLHGITQVHVHPRIGLGFAAALRSILRHDPDVIMIGEMRDLETAQIAIQSALTGHQVFSTLHTNDASSCVTRLLDMGIDDYLLTATISGVLAQRLVRRLCDHCKRPTDMSASALAAAGLVETDSIIEARAAEEVCYEAVGCEHCDGIGYRGRTAIAELLTVTEAVREAILSAPSVDGIRDAARADGMRPMQDDGLACVREGATSLAEVARVTVSR